MTKLTWVLLITFSILFPVSSMLAVDVDEFVLGATTTEGSGLIDDEDALEGSSLPPEIKYTTKSIVTSTEQTTIKTKPNQQSIAAVVVQDAVVTATTTRIIISATDSAAPSLMDSQVFLISLGILVFLIISAILIAVCCCKKKHDYAPAKQDDV